jgi:MFS transporter, Spinster family, sphingosine-1-phosphate transporter
MVESQIDATASDVGLTQGGDTGLFVLLCVINLLNYIDRAAINALVDPIRRDFHATDAQMGLVGAGFLLTYTILPPIFGWLGDRVPRTSLIAASAAFWSFATAATALVGRIWQLVAIRGAVGIGEASYMANSPSLIVDIFSPAQRGRAMSLFYTASPVGAALGVALGGLLWVHFGWRGAFVIVGLPGLLAAALIARQREPVRGERDLSPPPPAARSVVATLGELARNRLFVLLTIAYGGLVFTQNTIEYWLPTVLSRDKGMPLPSATALYGAAVLVAGITGPLVGVAIADALKRRDLRAYPHVAAWVAMLVPIPVVGIALTPVGFPLGLSVFGEAFLGNASIGIIITLIVAAVAPEIRSTATAVALTAVHLMGDLISQPLVGWLSTALERARSTAAIWHPLELVGILPPQHLLVALCVVVIPGAIATGAMFLVAARAARDDFALSIG